MEEVSMISQTNYDMPVIVGVVIAIMFLIAFSGWFYHLSEGWKDFVLDDKYFGYRIGSVSFISMGLVVLAFFAMAAIYKCPERQSTEGMKLLSGINCEAYYNLDTSLESLLSSKNSTY